MWYAIYGRTSYYTEKPSTRETMALTQDLNHTAAKFRLRYRWKLILCANEAFSNAATWSFHGCAIFTVEPSTRETMALTQDLNREAAKFRLRNRWELFEAAIKYSVDWNSHWVC